MVLARRPPSAFLLETCSHLQAQPSSTSAAFQVTAGECSAAILWQISHSVDFAGWDSRSWVFALNSTLFGQT
jgi:hypothetical protein